MPRKGKRRTIAVGIYEDDTGRSGIFRDALGRQRELRFSKHEPVRNIRKALDEKKRQNRGSGRLAAERGTLNHAINRWANLEQHLASWKERRAELRAWGKLYGSTRLSALTSDDVRRAISVWSVNGVSPKTIHNRVWTFRHLFHVLFGPDTVTPADHVSLPHIPRRVINPTSDATILAVYRNLLAQEQKGLLRDAKTRARFMVRAASGRRPCEIMRAQPADVDLELRVWRVRDAKGGWSEGLYLNDDLLAAWKLFVEADAWGEFSTHSQAKVLRHAGWPKGVRPYNLRHSVGIALSERGVDFVDVAGQLGQKDIRTTRKSYVPILGSRMERAGRLLDGRFGGWVPASVPAEAATDRSKLHPNKDRPKGKRQSKKAS